MNPAFLDSMSWEMAEVYGAITDQILINLARHFPFYNAGDPLPSSAFEYQAAMLAQMGQVNRETIRIIRNGLEDADEALQRVLEQAIIDSVRKAEPELLEGVKKNILHPAGIPIVAPNQMQAFQTYYKQASDKLNLVNTVMLESTKSAYQQTITDVVSEIGLADSMNRLQIALDTATGETITGVSSWNTALKHATDRMKETGITGFIDHAGRQWSAEAYVAMDIRTTVFNTGRASVWETNQNFGNDLYLVSYHNGARPLCYPWQNKVISSLNASRDVTDLDGNVIHVYAQSETSYGEAAGLFGINCKHYPNPFIPGVSVIDGHPQDPEENEKAYKESQEQRRLERKLREEKRDLMTAKAQGASQEELDRLQAKCRKSSEDIDEFCKETGRARHRDREAVYTKREFPDKEKYDVSKFERDQKDAIDKYFRDGGAQQSYTFGQMTPNVPTEPQRPENEPDYLKQFKRYDPATKTDAEKLAQVNPNFKRGTLDWTYNCQRCVATQEMIYRGYDVTAMPYNRHDVIASSGIKMWNIQKDFWKDPEFAVVPKRSDFMNVIKQSFDKWGDGARGVVRVQWTKAYGGNGHFIFARRVGDKIIFEDPQSGVVRDIADTLKKTTTGAYRMWVMRVDNREVNDNIVYVINNVGE